MRRVGVLICLQWLLAACDLSNMPVPRATYAPVPDTQLYARIAKLPGVTAVNLNWVNRFGEDNEYVGSIDVAPGVDSTTVLDEALAILRQGRAGAWYEGVGVGQAKGPGVTPPTFGLWSQADYTARYGPQPGQGVPPKTPVLRPTRGVGPTP